MCLIEPGPRSATVKAKTNVECLATSYEEFISAIGEDPQRTIEFMKTLVRRLRQMNDLTASADPRRRGLRAMVQDWVAPAELAPEVVAISWTLLW
jgi:CRP-like cAMP-binding protein